MQSNKKKRREQIDLRFSSVIPKNIQSKTLAKQKHPSCQKPDIKQKFIVTPIQLLKASPTKIKIPLKKSKRIVDIQQTSEKFKKQLIQKQQIRKKKKKQQTIIFGARLNNYTQDQQLYHMNLKQNPFMTKMRNLKQQTHKGKQINQISTIDFNSKNYTKADPSAKIEMIKNSLKHKKQKNIKKQSRSLGLADIKDIFILIGNDINQIILVPKKQYIFRLFDQETLHYEIRRSLQSITMENQYIQFPECILQVKDQIQGRCDELISKLFTQKPFQQKNTKILILPTSIIKIICHILDITLPMYLISLDYIQVVVIKRLPLNNYNKILIDDIYLL